MDQLNQLRDRLAAAARDIKVNIQSVLTVDKLDTQQVWGVAVTSAYFLKDAALIGAVVSDARHAGLSDDALEDCQAAASIMAMNTVYYRFRHMIGHVAGKESYAARPPRLRMQRIAKPAGAHVLEERGDRLGVFL